MTAKGLRTLLCVVGARPNYMKIGPVLAALDAVPRFRTVLIHTGQHYDPQMNDALFADLGIRAPDVNLAVGSASHAVQTAQVMMRFEPVVTGAADPVVLVVGDVNSTLACALVAAKLGVKVAHVEAGLRSGDRAMPEEINRILTDQLSDWLFCTEAEALDNLRAEGIDAGRVHLVGNVMIDTLLGNLKRAVPAAATLAGSGVDASSYGLVTLHRPANVDDEGVLAGLVDSLVAIAAHLPLAFPCHPRTRQRLEAFGFLDRLRAAPIALLEPQGYLAMLGLMAGSRLMLTDSGGIQEETTALGVPCLTLRDNTERPITVDEGTNTLVGRDPKAIMAAFADWRATGGKGGRVPALWDGRAAERIARILDAEA
ncbi:UDP-N-acetylglucosamine 2-epimerase (non-hydrolyzing) [Magnetospirillum sp. 15-1]|uniref:non-hydrolyzing UDP-N-acetylglucosamine 2-epimerase n=1 Tax=Magnetospirillum sp. 15-1 TaxID=1979370 RepID=UPI000BBB9A2B|nr:UDP-N-acetylglucosamine 2-epimerase (non-hydrolyzing) [Magnetospirillum sp. 15-1]